MQRIPREQLLYAFDPGANPVATVKPGEPFVVETHDTSTGRIHQEADLAEFLRVRDPQKVNPACGPLWVEGAQPGDALALTILKIKLSPRGFVRTMANAGVLQTGIEKPAIWMVDVDGDSLILGGKVRMPARPMVGVVGTAPATGRIYTADPGMQGSNMDYNLLREGATIHLPVHVPGALLGIGDLHAAMGDGEVTGTGIEIAGEVTSVVEIEPGQAPFRPWIENDESWIGTGQGSTLEEAVEMATESLVSLLIPRLQLTRTEAFLLVSARGDLRIGQSARIPGCDATAYAVFPKNVERL